MQSTERTQCDHATSLNDTLDSSYKFVRIATAVANANHCKALEQLYDGDVTVADQ